MPESMSIEDAVRAMIEGDDRVRLPLCYETVIGLPIFDHLKECRRILERRYQSTLECGTTDSQMIALQQLDEMETYQRNAQLYLYDLRNLADGETPGFSPDMDPPEEGNIASDLRLVLRSFLVPWAYKNHRVDIHQFYARQAGAGNGKGQPAHDDFSIPVRRTPTEEESTEWALKNLASTQDLRRAVLGDEAQAKPEYSEGQKLSLALASLLDVLLTKEHGDWRKIITDKTAKTSTGYFIKSRLNVTLLVGAVSAQLPVDIDGKDPAKTIEGHIKSAIDFWLHGPEFILDYSPKAMPKGYRTLYGLARAAWNILSGQAPPDNPTVKYPATLPETLSKGLTAKAPLTAVELEGCLERALHKTAGLYSSAPGDLP